MSMFKAVGWLASANLALALVLPLSLSAGEERACLECECDQEECYVFGYQSGLPACVWSEPRTCCGTPEQNHQAQLAACAVVEPKCEQWESGGACDGDS